MKLQTLSGIDKSIGGRPKADSQKRRHAFYLSETESELLKLYAFKNDVSVSALVRDLVKQTLKA